MQKIIECVMVKSFFYKLFCLILKQKSVINVLLLKQIFLDDP